MAITRDAKKAKLRRRYLKLTRELATLTQGYDCGNNLAGYINPRIKQVQDELDELVAEVKQEMASATASS